MSNKFNKLNAEFSVKQQTKISKKAFTAIAALLLVSLIASSMVCVSVAAPQPYDTKKTYAFINAVPNPIGVGEQTLINVGITEAIGGFGSGLGWTGLTVTVTKPDGTKETLGPYRTDTTGATGDVYVPDVTGNYTLQTHFPQQWYNTTGYGAVSTLYKASDSEPMTLIVQEEPVKYYPGNALPSEYWTRPIDAQLREWYPVSGNWLYDPANRFAPYNAGPETAHILWTKPITTGGLVGGNYGLIGSGSTSVGMGIGDAYEGRWTNRLILDGKLYYNTVPASDRPNLIHCVDLHTGEELWAKTFLDNQSLAFGQLFYWQSYNYQGVFAYLWVTTGGASYYGPPTPETWTAFDAYTGNWIATLTNVPSGTTMRDANGGLYRLQIDQTNGWMALWNMSALVSMEGSWGGGGFMGGLALRTINASATNPMTKLPTAEVQRSWAWNVTIPKNLPGSVQVSYFNDRVIGTNLASSWYQGTAAPANVEVWGLSLKEGQEGQVLFDATWNAPNDWIEGNQTLNWATFSQESKVGILWSKELRQHYGISLETGKLMWGPTQSQFFLDMYEGTQLTSHLVAHGRLYACGVSGIMYCYNVTTGKLIWTYSAEDPYTEMLWNNNWWLGITFITDDKVYVGSGEHSPNQPLPRGAPFLCLNATNGDLIWRANGLFRQTGWGGLGIIGDSVMATMDTYDQRIYAVGKGPSAITVTAPDIGVTMGTSIVLRGRVTDISPGTTDSSLTMRFPNGVPAVADECMSDWMLYVYKQFALPANATGVTVSLDVVDANGNFRNIGTTKSDASGSYSYQWTPDIPGKYTVFASFAGSGGYWPSSSETSFAVDEAPATPTPAVQQTGLATTSELLTYLTAGVIAIIIAIAVVGVLILRKRP